MNRSATEEDIALADHLIDKYRALIAERYTYEHLSAHFELSPQVTMEVVATLRNYFLQSLYPPASDRHKVDKAFESLRSFVTHPSKTWALLGNMASAIFKFGMQFPLALKAGIISLESYLDAKRFENELLHAARAQNLQAPLTDEEFAQCISSLPRKDLEKFLEHVVSVFKSMSNTLLLKKTLHIMDDVLEKVKQNKTLYSQSDVEGIELGIRILLQGYDLFKKYPDDLKKEVVALIRANEKWYLDQVFEKGGD